MTKLINKGYDSKKLAPGYTVSLLLFIELFLTIRDYFFFVILDLR